MSGTSDDAERPGEADEHTEQDAPTDQAHQGGGDGSLTGSTPAGLTTDALPQQASGDKPIDGGAG